MASGPPAPSAKRFVASVTISVPRERVFAYLENPALMRQWIAGLEEVTFDQPGIPRGVGTRFRQRMRTGGRSREYAGEVAAYRPPQEVAVRLARPRFSVAVEYRLAVADGGTRVEQVVALTIPGWLGRLLGGGVSWLLRRRQAEGLARLKAVAEAGGDSAPAV